MKKKWNKVTAALTYARDGSDDSARRCSGIICQGRAGHDGTSEIRKR